MTSFISHGFPNTVQGGVARKTDTQAQLQKDGSEVGPAEGVAVHVREAPSVPRWERGLEAAGPKDLAEPSLSQTGTGECWPSSGSARRWPSAGSQLVHTRMHRAGNQVTSPWKVVSLFFLKNYFLLSIRSSPQNRSSAQSFPTVLRGWLHRRGPTAGPLGLQCRPSSGWH